MKICLVGPCSPRDVSVLFNNSDSEIAAGIKGERGIPVSLLANSLVELGHTVTVVTSTDQVKNREEFIGKNFKMIVVPQRARARELALSLYNQEVDLLFRELSTLDVDIINAHWTYEYALAAMKCGSKVVVTAHDSPWQVLKSADHPFWFFRYLMALRLRIQSPKMIFVSHDLLKKWRREMVWRNSSWVIPNMQPFTTFLPVNSKTDASFIDIVSVGDASVRKNIEGSIASFSVAKKFFINSRLNLVGVGLDSGGSFFDEMSKKYDLGNVVWHGYLERSEYQTLLQSSDILLQPSLVESFGLTLLEAMALNVPVIAGHNTGAANEIVGDAGVLVDTRNNDEILSGLMELLGNANLRKDLSIASKIRAENFFSKDLIANATLECYKQIIANTK